MPEYTLARNERKTIPFEHAVLISVISLSIPTFRLSMLFDTARIIYRLFRSPFQKGKFDSTVRSKNGRRFHHIMATTLLLPTLEFVSSVPVFVALPSFSSLDQNRLHHGYLLSDQSVQ
jgi:hypothetical protein